MGSLTWFSVSTLCYTGVKWTLLINRLFPDWERMSLLCKYNTLETTYTLHPIILTIDLRQLLYFSSSLQDGIVRVNDCMLGKTLTAIDQCSS